MLSTATEATVLLADAFGMGRATGFVVHYEQERACIVTCSRVLQAAGSGAELRVATSPHSTCTILADGRIYGIDLAVVRADAFAPCQVYTLADCAAPNMPVLLSGFRTQAAEAYRLQLLHGMLGSQLSQYQNSSTLTPDQWELAVESEYYLPEGYDGAPVIEQRSGSVIGIAAHRERGQGQLIGIRALTMIWPESERLIAPRKAAPHDSFTPVRPQPRTKAAPPTVSQQPAGATFTITNSSVGTIIAGNQYATTIHGAQEKAVGQPTFDQAFAALQQSVESLKGPIYSQAQHQLARIAQAIAPQEFNLDQLELAVAALRRSNSGLAAAIDALLTHPSLAARAATAGVSEEFYNRFLQ